MTVFNNPNFSGNPNTTALTTQSNVGNGIELLTGSRLIVDNFAAVLDQQNGLAGIAADDGSSVSFGQTIPVANVTSIDCHQQSGYPAIVRIAFDLPGE